MQDAKRRATQDASGLSWLRGIGPLLGWPVAAACGWQACAQGDLLDAVLRGAGAWMAVLVLWHVGVGMCERLVEGAQEAEQDPQPAATAAAPGEDG